MTAKRGILAANVNYDQYMKSMGLCEGSMESETMGLKVLGNVYEETLNLSHPYFESLHLMKLF